RVSPSLACGARAPSRPRTIHLVPVLPAATPPPPPIVRHYIPYPARRKREMRAYARRHYGLDDYRLRAPKVIVEHVAVAGSTSAVFDTFAPDVPDPELHELPNVCSH